MAGPVLVLGGRGFFGSRICDELGKSGHGVVVAGRSGGDFTLDLLEPATIAAALREASPEAVICAAGLSSADAAAADPAACFRVNVTGAFNLLEALRTEAPGAHLTMLSSAAVYAPADGPIDEESATRPGSVYGASKLAAEVLCRQRAAAGLPVAALRVFNLIGPGQPAGQAPGELAREAVGARAAGAGSVSIRVRDPRIRRDYTDVRDAARAVVAVSARRLEGTFNLCSGSTLSLAELAGLTSDALSRDAAFGLDLVASLPPRASDPGVIQGDPSRIEARTGWSARIAPGDSVADLVAGLGAV